MSRIDEAFVALRAARKTGLIAYVTAGDPTLTKTAEILQALDRSGVDLIEVGVPFSDPLADGPVIQRATERALAGGATLTGVLDMLGAVRQLIRAPIVIFSYANPILRMGLDAFARRAREVGVDGVLTLDVPPEEAEDWRQAFDDMGLDTIFLLSPTTADDRIRRAADLGSGFLYGISRLGVTGARDTVADSAAELAARVRRTTDRPLALGFGVSRPEHVQAIGQYADAAVVGSALVSVIAEYGGRPDLIDEVERYIRWLRS